MNIPPARKLFVQCLPPKASGSALITGPLPRCILPQEHEAGFGGKAHIVTHRGANAFEQ